MAPGDGVAHRPQPDRQVERAAGQEGEAVLQAGQAPPGREDADPGRGQLDRQRQPVEPDADLRDRGRVLGREGEVGPDGAGALEEQGDRRVALQIRDGPGLVERGKRQRPEWELVLPRNAERGAAGHQHRQSRAGAEQVSDERGRRRNVLEVVQDQQDPARPQNARQALHGRRGRPSSGSTERFGDGGSTRAGSAIAARGTKATPSGKSPAEAGSDLERQPRLADPARTGQGDQAHVRAAQQPGDRRDLGLAADEGGQRGRQRRVRLLRLRERDQRERSGSGPVGRCRIGHGRVLRRVAACARP